MTVNIVSTFDELSTVINLKSVLVALNVLMRNMYIFVKNSTRQKIP